MEFTLFIIVCSKILIIEANYEITKEIKTTSIGGESFMDYEFTCNVPSTDQYVRHLYLEYTEDDKQRHLLCGESMHQNNPNLDITKIETRMNPPAKTNSTKYILRIKEEADVIGRLLFAQVSCTFHKDSGMSVESNKVLFGIRQNAGVILQTFSARKSDEWHPETMFAVNSTVVLIMRGYACEHKELKNIEANVNGYVQMNNITTRLSGSMSMVKDDLFSKDDVTCYQLTKLEETTFFETGLATVHFSVFKQKNSFDFVIMTQKEMDQDDSKYESPLTLKIRKYFFGILIFLLGIAVLVVVIVASRRGLVWLIDKQKQVADMDETQPVEDPDFTIRHRLRDR